MNKKCRRCGTEVTFLEATNNYRCLNCYPVQEEGKPVEEKERKYIDVQMTEAKVREIVKEIVRGIVRDEIENWVISRPAKEVVPETVESELDSHKNWRSEAKELGIDVYDRENKKPRLKVDVIAEIDEKLKVPIAG